MHTSDPAQRCADRGVQGHSWAETEVCMDRDVQDRGVQGQRWAETEMYRARGGK